ncbi:MFS transporter [Neptunomonas sp. XY-337]|uniref:MFS transporter n=1 Tax=Neptunomonas sp. XY-337 TaxID=2561897 RepID=UPI0010AAFC0C|nr:MFS transporter [Neptunomonas sp. XY-337]
MIDAGSREFWRATLALCLGSFMIFANVYVTQPLLPTLAEAFEISELQASMSLTVTTLTLGLSLLVYGPLSDVVGRKSVMVTSMVGAVLTTFLLSYVSNYDQLLLLRALQGFCLGGLPAIAVAYMGDEFRNKAMVLAVGLYISGNSLGGIGGRLIGGLAAQWLGWEHVFGVMAVMSLALLAIFVWLLPRSQHFAPRPLCMRALATPLMGHMRNPLLLIAYIIGGLNMLIFVNQYSFITFVLAEAPYSLSSGWLGMLFLTYLSGTIGSSIAGRVAQRVAQPIIMLVGIGILMTGTLVTLLPGITAILMGFLLNALGFFVAHSAASSWVSHRASVAKASASSLYLVFYYLGSSLGSFYLQPFWQWAGWQGVVVGSLVVLSLSLFAVCLLRVVSAQQRAASHTALV